MNVGPDMSLGSWVSKLQAALADDPEFDGITAGQRGGGQPLREEARRTTGIAANIPPTSENPEA